MKKTIKKTRKSNFSVIWVYDDDEDAYYLIPASAADMVDSDDAYPIIAEVRSTARRKTAYVLGMIVFDMSHQDDDGTYLDITKGEVIKALRKWGFEIEEEIHEI